jgi:hypothetical protein
MAGSATGPLAMGLLLHATGYAVAWTCLAAATGLGALVVARAASVARMG